MLQIRSSEIKDLMANTVHYYVALTDRISGWCILAGVDLEKGRHMALGRLSSAHPVVKTVRKREEVRNFLLHLRVYVRHRLDPAQRKQFLSQITTVNPITWDEAYQMVWGELSLNLIAFQLLCQRLPVQFVKDNATQRHATIVSYTKAILPSAIPFPRWI